MDAVKIFLLIFIVGVLSSTIPWLHFGVIMGLPAVLVNSLVLTILYINRDKL